MRKDFTTGSIVSGLLIFALPYMLSCFLQTFYGMADLFVTGQFNGADAISAVSIGSQVMHMLTVMIVGLAMGSTVLISQAVGKKEEKKIRQAIGNTVVLFSLLALLLTILLLLSVDGILFLLSTPPEAVAETRTYLRICFMGIPLIVAYNIISCVFRGIGDSRSPLFFILIACVFNIALDFLLVGGLHLGAAGAALATVISQGISVVCAFYQIRRHDLLPLFFTKKIFVLANR